MRIRYQAMVIIEREFEGLPGVPEPEMKLLDLAVIRDMFAEMSLSPSSFMVYDTDKRTMN
jgi:hypothetical protein